MASNGRPGDGGDAVLSHSRLVAAQTSALVQVRAERDDYRGLLEQERRQTAALCDLVSVLTRERDEVHDLWVKEVERNRELRLAQQSPHLRDLQDRILEAESRDGWAVVEVGAGAGEGDGKPPPEYGGEA